MNELPKSVRDALARQQAMGNTHPDADLLTAYAEGAATPAERAQMDAHLATCAECREALFLAAEALPAGDAASLRAAAPRRTRWFPVWVPWAAAAAMIVAVGTFSWQNNKRSTDSYMASKQEATAPATADADKVAPGAAESKTGINKVARAAAKEKTPAKDTSAPRSELRDKATDAVSAPKAAGLIQPTQNNAPVEQRPTMAGRRAPRVAGPSNQSMNQQMAQNNVIYGRIQSNTANTNAGVASGQAGSGQAKAADTLADAKPAANEVELKKTAPAATPAPAPAPPPPSVAETVAVTAQAEQVATYEQREDMAKLSAARQKSATAWRISDQGAVEHLLADEGWSAATGLPVNKYTVVATIGREVWAGGEHGVLVHSVDGTSWSTVALPANTDAAVTAIEFRDRRHGRVATADGHAWKTSNGGRSWKPE